MADMLGQSDGAPANGAPNGGPSSGRRPAKSAGAFRTISEVATDLDVPQHVLRFWETKFSQIRPLKRGGGRRYYRPEDVELLRSIRGLLYNDGYTIKGVQKLLREGGLRPTRPAEATPSARVQPAPTGPVSAEEAQRPAKASAPPEAPAEAARGLDPELRATLKALVEELSALRDLLRK